jgi:hypothetical protein
MDDIKDPHLAHYCILKVGHQGLAHYCILKVGHQGLSKLPKLFCCLAECAVHFMAGPSKQSVQ